MSNCICKKHGQVKFGALTLDQYLGCKCGDIKTHWSWKHDGDRVALHAINPKVKEMFFTLTHAEKMRLEHHLIKIFRKDCDFLEATKINKCKKNAKKIILVA